MPFAWLRIDHRGLISLFQLMTHTSHLSFLFASFRRHCSRGEVDNDGTGKEESGLTPKGLRSANQTRPEFATYCAYVRKTSSTVEVLLEHSVGACVRAWDPKKPRRPNGGVVPQELEEGK